MVVGRRRETRPVRPPDGETIASPPGTPRRNRPRATASARGCPSPRPAPTTANASLEPVRRHDSTVPHRRITTPERPAVAGCEEPVPLGLGNGVNVSARARARVAAVEVRRDPSGRTGQPNSAQFAVQLRPAAGSVAPQFAPDLAADARMAVRRERHHVAAVARPFNTSMARPHVTSQTTTRPVSRRRPRGCPLNATDRIADLPRRRADHLPGIGVVASPWRRCSSPRGTSPTGRQRQYSAVVVAEDDRAI